MLQILVCGHFFIAAMFLCILEEILAKFGSAHLGASHDAFLGRSEFGPVVVVEIVVVGAITLTLAPVVLFLSLWLLPLLLNLLLGLVESAC